MRIQRKVKKGLMRMRKRNIQIPLRLNEKEFKHLQKQVDNSCLNRESYLRSLILGHSVHPRPSGEVIQIYRLISTVANNVNQLAKIANATGYVDPKKIDGLLIMVDKCWQMIKEIC